MQPNSSKPAPVTSTLILTGFLLGVCWSLIVGCQTASDRQAKDQKKIEAKKEQIAAVDEAKVKEASAMVAGTTAALDKVTNAPPAVQVAKDLNARAAALIPATYADQVAMRELVAKLLSENEKLRTEGAKELAARDNHVVGLESKLGKLEDQMQDLEKQRDDNAKKAAELASKWQGLIRTIWWIAGGLIALVVLPPLLSIFGGPVGAGIATALGKVVGGTVGFVVKKLPGAVEGAGVVVKEKYDESQKALKDVIMGVQQLRSKPDIAPQVDEVMLRATDADTSRKTIRSMREEMHLVK